MSRPSVLIAFVAVLGTAAMATAFAAVNRARAQSREQARTVTTTVVRGVPQAPPLTPVRTAPPPPSPSYSIASVEPGRTVALRSKPNGRVVAHVASSTEFGGPTALAVATAQGGWLGVTSTALPNGSVAWVKSTSAIRLHATKLSIRVDLSKRTLELRNGSRTVRAFEVAIGRPGSPTPVGRYAITDKLSGSSYGPYYGCCILALSGHQPHTPPGWQGGDRLAIHGTDSPGTIGMRSSAGCLRASDANLRVLMRRVPVGTPVFIRA